MTVTKRLSKLSSLSHRELIRKINKVEYFSDESNGKLLPEKGSDDIEIIRRNFKDNIERWCTVTGMINIIRNKDEADKYRYTAMLSLMADDMKSLRRVGGEDLRLDSLCTLEHPIYLQENEMPGTSYLRIINHTELATIIDGDNIDGLLLYRQHFSTMEHRSEEEEKEEEEKQTRSWLFRA